jgi:uncharacterized membrane protein YfcA
METMPWYFYLFAVLVGFAAGIINTLAGNGSALTLPVLTFLGFTGIANATNRVGVAVQSLVGYLSFRRGGIKTDGSTIWYLILPAIVGSITGAQIAVTLNEKYLNLVIGGLMFLLLYIVIKNPERWLATQTPDASKLRSPKNIAFMFMVGIYGGFIQVGVGIFILATLVLGAGYNLTQANSIKSLLVFAFTVPALLIFMSKGMVNWPLGLLLTVGQAAGAWIAVSFAVKVPSSNLWIRRLLIVVLLGAVVLFIVKYVIQ